MDFKKKIREIKDWPQKGVNFKDITPLLQNPESFQCAIDSMAKIFADKKIDKVVGIDARGFILASAVAYKLGAGLVIIRKKGKLPYRTIAASYSLEYGESALEIHEDAILPGQKTLIIDDVLATGGTAKAAADLVKVLGGNVTGIAFLIELCYLKGRKKLEDHPVYSLISFES